MTSPLPSIRLHILYPPNSLLEKGLSEYFDSTERYTITLVSTANSIEHSRAHVAENMPSVVLLVDAKVEIKEKADEWQERIFQYAEDLSRDNRNISSVILTDVQAEQKSEYLERAMTAGIRRTVDIGRLGSNVINSYIEIDNAIHHVSGFSDPEYIPLESASFVRTIAVTSGKGGVGTSTVASALATKIAYEQVDKRVILVDFDVQFGAMRPMMLIDSGKSIAQLANRNTRDLVNIQNHQALADFVEIIPLGDSGINLYVLAAPESPFELSELKSESATAILSTLVRAFDYVIVDLPSRITNAAVAALQLAELVLVVSEPEVLSIRNNQHLLKVLDDQLVCSSRASKKMLFNKVWDKKSERLLDKLPYTVEEIESLFPDTIVAKLPYEPAFIYDRISRGALIEDATNSNPFLKELNELYANLNLESHMLNGDPKLKSKSILSGVINKFISR